MSPREGRAHFWGKREGEKRRKFDLLSTEFSVWLGLGLAIYIYTYRL